MVTVVDAVPALVFTGNVALVATAGTVTLEGTLAAPLLLESATCAPPAGAGPLSVTVPLEDCKPPVTLVGFSVSVETVGRGGGVTVRLAAVLVTLPTELVTTTVNCAPLSDVDVAGGGFLGGSGRGWDAPPPRPPEPPPPPPCRLLPTRPLVCRPSPP